MLLLIPMLRRCSEKPTPEDPASEAVDDGDAILRVEFQIQSQVRRNCPDLWGFADYRQNMHDA